MRLEAYLVGAAAEECRHVEVLLRGLFARRAGRGGRRRAGGAGGIARRLSLPSTLPGGHVELVLSASRGASLPNIRAAWLIASSANSYASQA